MSLFSTMNVAKQGLFAAQAGLLVTGNNISNAGVEGYTRQRVNLETQSFGGVRVAGIQRLADSFLPARIRENKAISAGREALSSQLNQLEAALNESDDSGLTHTIQEFFASIQSLTTNPSSDANRNAVRSEASSLIAAFQNITGNLSSMREQGDRQVQLEIRNANNLLGQIADLNKQIVRTETSGAADNGLALNSLLDRRDTLVDQLSAVMPIRVVENDNGGYTLFGADEVLLDGDSLRPLQAASNAANAGLTDVLVSHSGSYSANITSKLKDGTLGAALAARDAYVRNSLDEVERLAASMARDFNAVHRAGTGLDGVGGRDFFTALAVSAAPGLGNKGSFTLGGLAVTDESLLDFHDYEIRFQNPPTNFDIVDTTTGTTVATQAYASGAAITFRGMSVAITTSGAGPAAGDVVSVNSYDGTAERMKLDAAVAGDVRAIAAGTSGAPGDNSNALALAALRDATRMGAGGTLTYEGFYNRVRVESGLAAQSAQSRAADSQTIQAQLEAMRESVSGVSQDEEAANLIVQQRSFQAAGKVISIADEMMTSLLQIL